MIMRTPLLATLVVGLGLGLGLGCGGDDENAPFTSYQLCFDDFFDNGAGLPVIDSILTCCLDHPIAGARPACGMITADCINYLTANLNQTSASTTEVSDACGQYVGMLPPL